MDELSRVERNQLQQDAVESIRGCTEYIAEIAAATYRTYQQLVRAGFTDKQAFELVKARGWNLLETPKGTD